MSHLPQLAAAGAGAPCVEGSGVCSRLEVARKAGKHEGVERAGPACACRGASMGIAAGADVRTLLLPRI